MTAYVADFQKKRLQLRAEEKKLTALLRDGAALDALTAAAERVKAAQVRAARARQAQLAPSEKNLDAHHAFDRDIERWSSLAAEAVIASYRDKLK